MQASRNTGRRSRKSIGNGLGDDKESLVGSVSSNASGGRRPRSNSSRANASSPKPSQRPAKRARNLETEIREIYNEIKQKYTLEKWGRVAAIYRKNDGIIKKQLRNASAAHESRKKTTVTAPLEIPQLCNQLGHFEARINGTLAHVGVNIIPVVSLLLRRPQTLYCVISRWSQFQQ